MCVDCRKSDGKSKVLVLWILKKRMYKLWYSGNDAGSEGVEILVSEKICLNVVEIRRKSDKMMAIVLTFGREVMQIICGYGPQSRRPKLEKVFLCDEMASEWDL